MIFNAEIQSELCCISFIKHFQIQAQPVSVFAFFLLVIQRASFQIIHFYNALQVGCFYTAGFQVACHDVVPLTECVAS